MVEALTSQDDWQTTEPTPTTISGFEATALSLTIPEDASFAACDLGEFRSWAGRYYQGPGQTDRLWIMDLSGRRYVMFATTLPGAPEDRRQQQDQIVDSLVIEPL
jgi:hypothetical protein